MLKLPRLGPLCPTPPSSGVGAAPPDDWGPMLWRPRSRDRLLAEDALLPERLADPHITNPALSLPFLFSVAQWEKLCLKSEIV